jgi:hypothetical protein
MTFSQVNVYQNGAWVLPVKPSAQPTMVRTHHLPQQREQPLTSVNAVRGLFLDLSAAVTDGDCHHARDPQRTLKLLQTAGIRLCRIPADGA